MQQEQNVALSKEDAARVDELAQLISAIERSMASGGESCKAGLELAKAIAEGHQSAIKRVAALF